MAEVTWLLDVDGVINAARPGWGAAPRRGHAYAIGREWRIRWAPALATRIREIHAAGVVEVVWATTWCPDADQIERLLRLPPLRRAWTDHRHGPAARDAKFAAALTELEAGRRLVWTDDEAIPTDPDRLAQLDGALLIAPEPGRGLQPADVDAIVAFSGHTTAATVPSGT